MTEIIKDIIRDEVSDDFLYSSTIIQAGKSNLVTPVSLLIT